MRPAGKRIAIIGAQGHQGQELIDAVSGLEKFELVALIDNMFEEDASATPPRFATLDSAMLAVVFDIGIVAVPHSQHLSVASVLLKAGKWVLKEKPFATTREDATQLLALADVAGTGVITLTQRPQRLDYLQFARSVAEIGIPYWYSYTYELAIPEPTSGWRAIHDLALGGVVLDMGYHVLDVVLQLFGQPDNLDSSMQFRYEPSLIESLEDLASVHLHYEQSNLTGTIMVARHSRQHSEHLVVHGTNGIIELDPRAQRVDLFDVHGEPKETWQFYESASEVMCSTLTRALTMTSHPPLVLAHMSHHEQVVNTYARIYENAAAHGSQSGFVGGGLNG